MLTLGRTGSHRGGSPLWDQPGLERLPGGGVGVGGGAGDESAVGFRDLVGRSGA